MTTRKGVGEPERFPGTALRVDDGTTPVIRCRVCATKGVWGKLAAEAAGVTGKNDQPCAERGG